ncbi:DNA-directed RNA polymerase III subunit RPC9-like [Teleopsis dalmanni]|uniref:DNA-directed RNA polymerase III subunit RPC9-like n=1 Tax=Teleopsis dalmanni TaxID=139649 RepID=UPI0018CD7574|nr:DNA-directed RNA polymerase III subunit RPC9-like [Teleopsis dalmanni]XP_037935103.1 DNA-directed RNA polymerase III subunit RPC9-like [Teleopsis dalmanni]
MEIVNPCYSLYSNLEVMETLKNSKDTKKKYGLRNLATISYETLQYLEDTPCKVQSKPSIATFLKSIEPYKLTSNECLMITNDPPTCALHVQLLVEDSEERFTEQQVNELLDIVKQHFSLEERN